MNKGQISKLVLGVAFLFLFNGVSYAAICGCDAPPECGPRPSCGIDDGSSIFTTQGSAKFSPWSTIGYCDEARELANKSADNKCATLNAQRVSDYIVTIANITCVTSAQYVCD